MIPPDTVSRLSNCPGRLGTKLAVTALREERARARDVKVEILNIIVIVDEDSGLEE
jgi:hypothetical protein